MPKIEGTRKPIFFHTLALNTKVRLNKNLEKTEAVLEAKENAIKSITTNINEQIKAVSPPSKRFGFIFFNESRLRMLWILSSSHSQDIQIFVLTFLLMYEINLMISRLISKFMMSSTRDTQKAIRQRNLVSLQNIIEIFFFRKQKMRQGD